MNTNISKKESLANKVKNEIREINNIIRRMKIKTDNVHDLGIRQHIIQLLSMYVQNGDPLMYAVLNEMAKSMINDPSALKVITYEETEVEIPECYVFFQDYVKNKISRLENILTYDDIPAIKPVQNNLLNFNRPGALPFNPTGANTFNPTGANTFNPTGANTFNPTGANTFNPTGANTFNPTGANTFNPVGTKLGSPADIPKNPKVTFGPTNTLNEKS